VVGGRLGRSAVACALVGLVALAGTIVPAPRPAAADAQAGVSPTIAAEFVWAIDVVRTERGLPALVPDAPLSVGAQEWSGGMALLGTLVHDQQLGAVVSAVDPGWRTAGENIGTGTTPQAIEGAFVASPPHLANMLGPYTHVGVGAFVDGAGRLWVTERFYR